MLNRILARPRETLTVHTLAVLERINQLAALHGESQNMYPQLWDRLRWAALLHDSGKLAAGFQRGLRNKKARWGLRHEVLSLGFVAWFAFTEADLPWVIAAIASHHRDADYILNRYRARPDPADDLTGALIAELDAAETRGWYDWLAAQIRTQPGLSRMPAIRPFAMPTTDDIRAALNCFEQFTAPLAEHGLTHPNFSEATLLRGFMLMADHAGAAHARPFIGTALDPVALTRSHPYPHQKSSAESTHDVLLLIAPTGSGKTEAALQRVQAANPARLLYLLPYRASMDAMQCRLEQYAPAESIGLQHGRALQSLYRRLLEEGRRADDATQGADARMNLARLHTYPIRVASPYHLLRAAYQFKGFEAILADCWHAWLIVDEIHAYDPARLALIVETLRFLREQFAVRLFIMTATLAPVVREVLIEALSELATIEADAPTFAQFQRHRAYILPGSLDDHLETIIAEAQAGKGVLVVVNTVRRARELSRRLRTLSADSIEVITLHSRFNSQDRWTREQRVLNLYGVGMTHSAAPRPIVVATQVIEVSLNVDFDVLYSDPAPLDALVQRFGRVNRAREVRQIVPVYICELPTGAEARHPIYDPALVTASLDTLRQHDGDHGGALIDEARISEWLATVYSEDRADRWRAAYAEKQVEFRRAVLELLTPFESAKEDLVINFAILFDGIEILPLALEEDYRARLRDDPIGASMLLVPISWWQYKMLERRGVAWAGEGEEATLYFTDVPYDPLHGLRLEADEEEDS